MVGIGPHKTSKAKWLTTTDMPGPTRPFSSLVAFETLVFDIV